jgi:hypothetical protein
MAHRAFKDNQGRAWQVWSVLPTHTERRVGAENTAKSTVERRKRNEFRVKVNPRWAHGWLAFETRGEKRRLAPFPSNWAEFNDGELSSLCEEATKVKPSRRLIE